MADENAQNKEIVQPEPEPEPQPLAEDLSDSELEDVSGGTTSNNKLCGFGC